jgi:hypothetical protein
VPPAPLCFGLSDRDARWVCGEAEAADLVDEARPRGEHDVVAGGRTFPSLEIGDWF